MTKAKIDIDMDKPCTRCGQMGATQGGALSWMCR
jgi:hypothetical protein